jgi:hypothetical protein
VTISCAIAKPSPAPPVLVERAVSNRKIFKNTIKLSLRDWIPLIRKSDTIFFPAVSQKCK